MDPSFTNGWNQANLGYFDPCLDNIYAHQIEVELVRQEVYYQSIILFVEQIKMLVACKDVALVKANISAFLPTNITPEPHKKAPLPSQSKVFYQYQAQQASVTRQE